MVNIEMANGKNIKIELYPDVAPITVANFEKLVKEGFYDGLLIHTMGKVAIAFLYLIFNY